MEEAHRRGILTAASLMVAGNAAEDAVRRARTLPSLRVGLHLVVVCGRPVLDRAVIPDLVGGDGRFRENLVRAGFSFFFRPAVRRQLEAEIRSQFESFRRTGLPLDHVNAHNHMHLHPTVLNLILKIGRDYGITAVRLPREPFLPSWRATGSELPRRFLYAFFLAPWAGLMKMHLMRNRLICNDALFGIHDTGRMTSAHLLRVLENLPSGLSEIYFHPSTGVWDEIPDAVRGYRMEEELAALVDPAVIEATRAGVSSCAGFSGAAAPAATEARTVR